MQNINLKVQHFLKRHKKQHIYMAVAASLSLIVMLSVFTWLIKPGISATRLSDSSSVDDAEMLVGTNSSIKGNTVSETIQNANDMYLLGIASHFSVFLEEDFTITAADTEGRLACGGSLDTAGYLYGSDGGDGYRIGLGHYLDSYTSINLVDELYGGTYAHAIVGGNITAKLATNPSIYENDGTVETRWRTVLVNSESNLDASYTTTTTVPGVMPGFPGPGFPGPGPAPGPMGSRATEYLNCFYTKTSEVLDFQAAFDLLEQRSNTIASFASLTENTVVVDVDAQTVTFIGPGTDKIADSIMFNVTAEQWSQISAMTKPVFMYENIPQLSTPTTGIEVRGKEDTSTSTTVDASVVDVTWENSYIIINVEGSGNLQMPQAAVSTSVNGYWINKGGKNADDVNANLNNKFGCSTILYNFSDATGLKLGGDFQGTILAPLADVTDMSTGTTEGCKGHLSGVLVAKSFDGATQFGYRTNLSTIEMLNTTAQYEVNVDKFDEENRFLSGATLGLYTVDGNGELSSEPIYSWTSGLSSETIIVEADVRYAVKEIAAPDGYEMTEKIYYFMITEGEQQYATATVDTREILGFFYIPTVDITVYDDSSFSSKTVTVTYSTTDLNQTSYKVDDSVYSGNELPAGVYVDDYNDNKFVSKDGVLLTPIVNLNQDITVDDENNFTFVNKPEETLTPTPSPSPSPTPVAGVADVIGEINVDKLDGDNNNSGLSGATIQLYKLENGSETLVQEYITDGNTKTLSGIESGDYKLLESSAPEGYELSDTVYYFRVTKAEQQKASLSVDNGAESVTIDLNYVPSISITVYSDSDFSSKIGTAMYSATYPDNVSFNIDGEVYSGTDLPDTVSVVDYNGCKFVVKGEEVLTPIINLNRSVWLNGNNTFMFINTKGIKGADITLRKVNIDDATEAALSNACIELYDAHSNVNIAKYILGISAITNGLDVDYILDGGLKPGNYYFKETKVPDGGYLLPEDNTFEFTVNEDGTITEGSDYLKYSAQYDDTLLILNEQGIYVEKVWKNASGDVIDAPFGEEITVNIYESQGMEEYSLMKRSLDGDSGAGADTSSYTIDINNEISDSETESELVESFLLSSENNWKKDILILGVEDYNNGNYHIEEVAVPGYKTEVAEEAVQQDDGTYVIVITNTQHSYKMPSTGSTGTIIFILAGTIFISVSCIGLIAKRRTTLAKINNQ